MTKSKNITINGVKYTPVVKGKKAVAKSTSKGKTSGMDRLKAQMGKFDNAILSISKGKYTRKSDAKEIVIDIVKSKNGETFNVTASTYWKV